LARGANLLGFPFPTPILVSDATERLVVLGFDGLLRHEATTTTSILAATAGCGDDWLVYCPRFGGGTNHAGADPPGSGWMRTEHRVPRTGSRIAKPPTGCRTGVAPTPWWKRPP